MANPPVLKAFMLCLILSVGSVIAGAQNYQDFTTKTPLGDGQILVIGILGGRESWDNEKQGVRKFALKLRAKNLPGVSVETIENTRRRLAIELIGKAFDRNQDERLDERERASARVIIYGQSFGGAAVVKLARQLAKMKVPVLLTVQIDSVGRDDQMIPPNVERAANLFQRNGWFIKGEPEIRPEDIRRTTIIGNYEFDYRQNKMKLSQVPWLKKLFRVAHTKMDQDPAVWELVEKLILDTIPAKGL